MKISKIFSLMLLYLAVTGKGFSGDSGIANETVVSSDASPAEKRFVKAFNTFKKLSGSYPSAEEALEKIRELEGNDTHSIRYILAHPRLIKKAIREEVLRELGASEEDIAASNAKARGKRYGAGTTKSDPSTSQKVSSENILEGLSSSLDPEHSSSRRGVEENDHRASPASSLSADDSSSEISAPSSFQLSDLEDDLDVGENEAQSERAHSSPLGLQDDEEGPKQPRPSSAEVDPSNIIEGARNRKRKQYKEEIEGFLPMRRATKPRKEYAHKQVQAEQAYAKVNKALEEPQIVSNDDVIENSQGSSSKNTNSKTKRTRLEREMAKLL